MTDLIALREQVRALTGPSAEVDRLLLPHFDPEHPGLRTYPEGYTTEWRDGGFSVWGLNYSRSAPYPRFTASVDACIQLAERLWPAVMWSACYMEDGPFAQVIRPMPNGGYVDGLSSGTGATPPLAMLDAILSALIAGATNDY